MVNKGIKFDIISKDDAITFLNNNTYFTKLYAFKHNYMKNKSGKYVNLDFAYLKELSTIDMYLRKVLFDICLDIEHYMKINILNYLSTHNYDGYDIMIEYLNYNKNNNLDSLKRQAKTSYTRDLIDRHYPYVPVWVFLETASTGQLINFYDFYKNKINTVDEIPIYLFESLKSIRNAGGHNSCILNNLFKSNDSTDSGRFINNWIKVNLKSIGDRSRKNNLKNVVKKDIIITLFIFNKFVTSQAIKNARYKELNELLNGRFVRNKEYFYKNDNIKSSYIFMKKVVDYFSSI